jgi:hypothetical protein
MKQEAKKRILFITLDLSQKSMGNSGNSGKGKKNTLYTLCSTIEHNPAQLK